MSLKSFPSLAYISLNYIRLQLSLNVSKSFEKLLLPKISGSQRDFLNPMEIKFCDITHARILLSNLSNSLLIQKTFSYRMRESSLIWPTNFVKFTSKFSSFAAHAFHVIKKRTATRGNAENIFVYFAGWQWDAKR